MEGIAVWREAEPRQEPAGAKPTLQNTPQDYAAQVKITPGRKTGMVLLTGHGGQVQPQDRDIAFSLASQMNYLQASSRLFSGFSSNIHLSDAGIQHAEVSTSEF